MGVFPCHFRGCDSTVTPNTSSSTLFPAVGAAPAPEHIHDHNSLPQKPPGTIPSFPRAPRSPCDDEPTGSCWHTGNGFPRWINPPRIFVPLTFLTRQCLTRLQVPAQLFPCDPAELPGVFLCSGSCLETLRFNCASADPAQVPLQLPAAIWNSRRWSFPCPCSQVSPPAPADQEVTIRRDNITIDAIYSRFYSPGRWAGLGCGAGALRRRDAASPAVSQHFCCQHSSFWLPQMIHSQGGVGMVRKERYPGGCGCRS